MAQRRNKINAKKWGTGPIKDQYPICFYSAIESNTALTTSSPICPGALESPALAKVMAEPNSSPHNLLATPSLPMLIATIGVAKYLFFISTVAASQRHPSVLSCGIAATFGKSAPTCCILTIRETSSFLSGVF